MFRPSYSHRTFVAPRRPSITSSAASRVQPNLNWDTRATRALHATRQVLSLEQDFKHRDTKWNNEKTPFDFTPENYKEIQKVLRKFPTNRKRSGILPLLHIAQIQNRGWIPLAAMNKIASIVDVHPMRVYEVATFYSMFNRDPVGKFHIQVCVTTPCMVCGSDDLVAAIEKHLDIHMGETTKDGMFTLGEMECMGACVNAPMIVVSDYRNPDKFTYNYYEDLTVERTVEILDMLRRGEQPPVGSQTGRKNCMGIQGKTSLFEEPQAPHCRDLNKIRQDLEKKKEQK